MSTGIFARAMLVIGGEEIALPPPRIHRNMAKSCASTDFEVFAYHYYHYHYYSYIAGITIWRLKTLLQVFPRAHSALTSCRR